MITLYKVYYEDDSGEFKSYDGDLPEQEGHIFTSGVVARALAKLLVRDGHTDNSYVEKHVYKTLAPRLDHKILVELIVTREKESGAKARIERGEDAEYTLDGEFEEIVRNARRNSSQ